MLHIVSGYGRDALGEQCVLAFTYGQQPSPAHLFLGYMGGWELKKRVKRGGVPVFRAVREGQRLGQACPRLVECAIRDLLPLPLDEARRRLNIARRGSMSRRTPPGGPWGSIPMPCSRANRQWRPDQPSRAISAFAAAGLRTFAPEMKNIQDVAPFLCPAARQIGVAIEIGGLVPGLEPFRARRRRA